MNAGPFVFLASFFALAVSWLGFVLAPQLQLGNRQQVESRTTGDVYPHMRAGMARQGEQVYRANGCNACHTQQVRYKGFGGDYARGWGGRDSVVQSVDEDYLYDRPAMLGTIRVGPDLANIGLRQTNANILLQHIYSPTNSFPHSVMPPYRYLFEKGRKLAIGQKASDDSVAVEKGYEIVPTDEARALAAYLISLRQNELLYPETPPLTKPTNAVPATNAVKAAASTNNVNTNTPAK
ncbi:MAG TPA: cbb3-type cytochrome c oxidase subunit II [Verrucomicrobiae bacterium]|nr:cbb3-type cytochrome c oxidase subunit II [Verrucomicrobiae bacterium]